MVKKPELSHAPPIALAMALRPPAVPLEDKSRTGTNPSTTVTIF
jgi:hypothetical protein